MNNRRRTIYKEEKKIHSNEITFSEIKRYFDKIKIEDIHIPRRPSNYAELRAMTYKTYPHIFKHIAIKLKHRRKIMKRIISVLLMLTLTSCNKEINVPLDIANEAIIVREYVQDILKVYDFEYFAYTYQDCLGNFNVEGDDFMIITFYTEESKYEFVCWHKGEDIDWEVLNYEIN